ncbi:hypothetical protein [Pontimicrobium aquaticum]|uniref:Polysaccharide biosynthesis protein n=1 Tax=Pontimicrobium aquaticum TaxID=2565367 RepID=A0A4V5LQL1_9FLAO|nr:hypothetical protein [Pontimicrobium aquaticum]TJY34769.1 hypothetical protein E5167_10705 [Pontimicrobium aquaticum]
MIKKILVIGLFTGLAHLLSFYGVSFIVKMNADKIFVSKIAEIESAIALMLSIMSFGLQQVATRDIAIKDNWRKVLILTQKNRLSMSLFLVSLGLFLYMFTNDTYYFIFFLAPFLALNVDYALYGRGFSVQASFLSLIKVGIPAVVLIILGLTRVFSFKIYIIATIVSWLIIGFFSNKILNVLMLLKPRLGFIKSYLKRIKIGFTDIAITTLKLGILTLAKPLYEETIIANAFVVLKIYVLVKGIQRVIFQAFYKDLVDEKKAFLIDKMGFVLGFIFFSITFFYPNEIITFLFTDDYISSKHLFTMIGFTMLISSISISVSPRMLLLKRDKGYINSYLYALIGALIFLLIVSKTSFYFYGIIGAILFGETILNLLFFFFSKGDIFTYERLWFLMELGLLFIIFALIYFNFETQVSLLLNTICFVLYGIYFMIRHKKQFL